MVMHSQIYHSYFRPDSIEQLGKKEDAEEVTATPSSSREVYYISSFEVDHLSPNTNYSLYVSLSYYTGLTLYSDLVHFKTLKLDC